MSQQEEIYEEEEEKERRRKEAFQVGRILGVVKRKDPELYETIVQIAEAEGKKATDVIIEALMVYRDYKYMVGVDGRCLAYALNIIDMLMKRLMQMMLTINQYFTSEFFQQQIELLADIQQRQQQIYQHAMKQAKDQKLAPIKEQLAMNLINMVLNMVTNMMSSLLAMRTGAAHQQGQAPMPSLSVTPSQGQKKVKVVDKE